MISDDRETYWEIHLSIELILPATTMCFMLLVYCYHNFMQYLYELTVYRGVHIPCKSSCIWSYEKEIKHCTFTQGIFPPTPRFFKTKIEEKKEVYKMLIKIKTIFKILKVVLNGLDIDLA
jgi:hypothetical protein